MDAVSASPSPNLRRSVLSPSPARIPLPPSGPSSRRGSSTAAIVSAVASASTSGAAAAGIPPPLMSMSPRTLLRPRLDRMGTTTLGSAGALMTGSLLKESDPFWEGATITVNHPVGSLSISPNSRDICLASRKGLYILDLKNLDSAPRFIPQGGTWQIADCQWSPHAVTDNLILSTSSQKLLVWDLAAQVPLFRSVDAHERAITDINWHALDPNLMATVAMDAGIRGWDLRMGCQREFMRLSAWGAAGTQVKWNRRVPHILATAHGKDVIVWDKRKGSIPLVTLKAHDAKIYGIDWDRRYPHKLVTCSLDKTIKTWHIPALGQDDMDEGRSSPYAARTIVTDYPVWRARNLPFGRGILSLPQRGETALDMYGENSDVPLERFEGAQNQVKEFVWRVRGGEDLCYEDRDFQLITWSKDRKLRVWPVPREVCERVGYKRGAPITVLVSRKGADPNKTFNAIPDAASSNNNNARSNLGNNTYNNTRLPCPIVDNHTPMPSGIARQRLLAHPRESGMTRGGGSAGKINQIEWLTKVVTTKGGVMGTSESSTGPSRAPSVSGDSASRSRSRTRTFGNDIRPLSLTNRTDRAASTSRVGSVHDSMGTTADLIPLKDEVVLVHKMFPKSKVNFEKVDLTLRKLTMSLNGPWANGDRFAFIRVHWSFPVNYPYSSELPTFELERNATVSPITRHRMVSTMKEIRANNRQCLVSVTEFLLGYHERVGGRRVIDDDGSQSDSDAPIQNAPKLLRTTGAVFGPNGQLACFFPKQTVLPRSRTALSRSPSGVRDPAKAPLNRALAALARLENPSKPLPARTRRHVRRLRGMANVPEQARSTVTLHSVAHLVGEPDMVLAAQYSTTSIDANLVYALDAKRLDHAEIWASLRAILRDPPPPYSAHAPLHRPFHRASGRARMIWEREMERKRCVLDTVFERLMDAHDIQLLALIACVLAENDKTTAPPPIVQSIVQHSPEQDYFVLPGEHMHRESTITVGSSHTVGNRRHSSLTPPTPIPSSGPSSLRTSGWSQILMNPSSISLRGMTLSTPRDRTSFEVVPRTPLDSFQDEHSSTAAGGPSPPVRPGMIIPRSEIVASPLAHSAPKTSMLAASPRRILERHDSQQRMSRDPRPRPLNSPNTPVPAPPPPHAGSGRLSGPTAAADRDRSGSSDAAAGMSGWGSIQGSRATKVSFGSGSPLRRAFSRHAVSLPFPPQGPATDRRRRAQTCSVRIDFGNGGLGMNGELELAAPTSLLRSELLPLAEVWKLAYADMLLRAGLVGRRAALLQYQFAPIDDPAGQRNPDAPSGGEIKRHELVLATVCTFCGDSVVAAGEACDACLRKRAPPQCSGCRQPIRGLATTCTVCSHTSHTTCLLEVMVTKDDHCPACTCRCLAERGLSGGFLTAPRPPEPATAVAYGFTPERSYADVLGLGGVSNMGGFGAPGGLSLTLGPLGGMGGMGMSGLELGPPVRRLSSSPTANNFDGPYAAGSAMGGGALSASPTHHAKMPMGGALELTDEQAMAMLGMGTGGQSADEAGQEMHGGGAGTGAGSGAQSPPQSHGGPPLVAPQPQGMLARTRLRALGTEGLLGW